MSDTPITYYPYEPVQPEPFTLKEGDRLRVTWQTPDGPIERIFIAGPPVPADDSLNITQRFTPLTPEYEVIQ